MGDGEEVVVADVVAAGLPRVAVKIFLIVAPYLLSSHNENHEPEYEHHGEPYAAEDGGVLVDSAQEALEKGPVHDVLSVWSSSVGQPSFSWTTVICSPDLFDQLEALCTVD